jgi:bifunctional NMN adenylyltransferase/nudix hydrolase
MKLYDYIVFLGRFEPFHIGHMSTLMKAIRQGQKVIVLLGTANSPRTYKNPWTAEEREVMIRSSLSASDNKLVEFAGVEDRLYHTEEWPILVRQAVEFIIEETSNQLVYEEDEYNDPNREHKIAIIGHDKDETSFYLRIFPDWTVIETAAHISEKNNNGLPLSSTKIRELIFTDHLGFIESNVPAGIYSFIENFVETDEYKYVKADYDHYYGEEQEYRSIPYWMNFWTADACVFQSAHVLLVKRKDFPGKGLWALPGGHISPTETSFEAAIRELKEETKLKVPTGKLIGSKVLSEVFEHPDRSLRCRVTGNNGRTVTRAYCFDLDGIKSSGETVTKLPKVQGTDDAIEAKWFPITEVRKMRNQMFEDHPDIIEFFLNHLPKKGFSSW